MILFFYKLPIVMINTIIIEIVDIVFVILFDNSSSPPFSLGVFDKRDVGELFVVVGATVAAIVVVATVGNVVVVVIYIYIYIIW